MVREMIDNELMQRAIDLARTKPRSPFGSIIVNRSARQIVAEGVNLSGQNLLWHGEIVAINDAVDSGITDWSELTLYTTAEPCPMCMSAILWSGIGAVVYGVSIPKLMELGWNQIDIRAASIISASHRPETQLVPGVLEASCSNLFQRAAGLASRKSTGSVCDNSVPT